MIAGIGTDIIEVRRIQRAISGQRFRDRVYSAAEQDYCQRRGAGAAASFAARFAGKEAFLKALGTGLRGGALKEIEILDDALGCPHIRLRGYFSAYVKAHHLGVIHISLSHTKEYATAACVIEKEI